MYNQQTGEALKGGDTVCKVTILDEDFPGTIEFAKTEVEVSRKAQFVDIEIQRIEGSDGTIHCEVKTEEMKHAEGTHCAQPFEHYMPMQSIITFPHSETTKVIRIELAKI